MRLPDVHVVQLNEGEIIFREGDPGDLLFNPDRSLFQRSREEHGRTVDARPALRMLSERSFAALPSVERGLQARADL